MAEATKTATKAAEGSPATAKTDTKAAEDTGRELPAQRVKTIDSAEETLGWTAQHGSMPEPTPDKNPVTFSADEMPDDETLKEQGVDVETYKEMYYPDVE